MFEAVLEQEASAQGVVRFVIEPAFDARQFYTFLYTPDAVLVQVQATFFRFAGNFLGGSVCWRCSCCEQP
jgi:hypothetical protein